MHKDSGGHESVISAGGVQWMTAGSGLIHAEVSSQEFKKNGGPLEILQLWINLPAKLKMTPPRYIGLQKKDIPVFTSDEGKVTVNLISGTWQKKQAAFETLSDVNLNTINFNPDGKLSIDVPDNRNILFYVIKGSVVVNGKTINAFHLAEFNNDDEELSISSTTGGIVLFGHAQPFHEPVVAQGPFVMNTEEEIVQAYEDYRNGKFGDWK